MSRVGLAIVAALTTAALVVLEARVRLLDTLRDRARF